MASYWVSFRIGEETRKGKTDDQRRDDLDQVITDSLSLDAACWDETTSFICFESDENIDTIANRIKAVISEDVDLFLIRSLNKPEARICGDTLDADTLSYLMRRNDGTSYLIRI